MKILDIVTSETVATTNKQTQEPQGNQTTETKTTESITTESTMTESSQTTISATYALETQTSKTRGSEKNSDNSLAIWLSVGIVSALAISSLFGGLMYMKYKGLFIFKKNEIAPIESISLE
jgi:hypothetical protein